MVVTKTEGTDCRRKVQHVGGVSKPAEPARGLKKTSREGSRGGETGEGAFSQKEDNLWGGVGLCGCNKGGTDLPLLGFEVADGGVS